MTVECCFFVVKIGGTIFWLGFVWFVDDEEANSLLVCYCVNL